MKNKAVYIGIIIRASIIFSFLFTIIIKNHNMISRMIIMPFLLCSFFSLGKNICLMFNKKKIALIFSKLFILSFLFFWFGFLIYGSYHFIKENSYISLLFTIPFWIAGIYIVNKFLLGINSKKILKMKESKFNLQIIVSSFF